MDLPPFLANIFPQYALLVFFLFALIYSFCIPITEEIVLLLVGYLSKKFDIPIVYAMLASFPGFVISDYIYFLLARVFGSRIIRSKFFSKILNREKIKISEVFFQRKGPRIIFFCRFVPGLRLPMMIASGLLKMPFGSFALFDTLSAVISTIVWGNIGYSFGSLFYSDMDSINKWIKFSYPFVIVIAFVFLYRKVMGDFRDIKKELTENGTLASLVEEKPEPEHKPDE